MRFLASLFLGILALSPALAAETPWQDVAPGVRLRLIAGDVLKPNGTTLVGLEIDMPRTSKTYWRVPGETGIPTEIGLEGSTGIGGHEVLWPYPVIDTTGGFVDFVYYGPTVLPVELTVTGPTARLEAQVVMGICSDICVPAIASFSLPLDFAAPDRGQGLRIAQALARTPIDWDDPRDPIGTVRFDRGAGALEIQLGDARVDPLSFIVDSGNGGQLFGAPQKSPDGKVVVLPLLGGPDDADVVGQPVHLTFMTEMGPFAVSRRIAPAGSTAGVQ